MSDSADEAFSFDFWSRLAVRDPAEFEVRRREVLEGFINSQAPERRHRLRCLQWRIDRERERCATPLAACTRLSNMMWESFAGDGGLVDSLEKLCGRLHDRPRALAHSARILPFPTRRH